MSLQTMPFDGLERTYEHLADALDAVGPDKTSVYLTKVVLLLAARTGDESAVSQAIKDAQADL
ncbi:MAG: DUF2783 domain-containing protein [Pseudomonadota bacterium]